MLAYITKVIDLLITVSHAPQVSHANGVGDGVLRGLKGVLRGLKGPLAGGDGNPQTEQHDTADTLIRVRSILRCCDVFIQGEKNRRLPMMEEHRTIKSALFVVPTNGEEWPDVQFFESREIAAPAPNAPLNRRECCVREKFRDLREEEHGTRQHALGRTRTHRPQPNGENVNGTKHRAQLPQPAGRPWLGFDIRRLHAPSFQARGAGNRDETPSSIYLVQGRRPMTALVCSSAPRSR